LQLFTAIPQFLPMQASPLSVQPHTPGVPPPPQLWGGAQEPQLSVWPQPSGIGPQLPGGHVIAVQPQTFGCPPPPQVWGEVQLGPQTTA
jgi:hypothetical protein